MVPIKIKFLWRIAESFRICTSPSDRQVYTSVSILCDPLWKSEKKRGQSEPLTLYDIASNPADEKQIQINCEIGAFQSVFRTLIILCGSHYYLLCLLCLLTRSHPLLRSALTHSASHVLIIMRLIIKINIHYYDFYNNSLLYTDNSGIVRGRVDYIWLVMRDDSIYIVALAKESEYALSTYTCYTYT